MFSTIVVGTDGSPDAERALEVAAGLARMEGRPDVHVVTAYRPLGTGELESLARDLPDEFHPLLHAHVGADSSLNGARAIMARAGVDATYHDIDADPTEALLDIVDRAEADLLIVGSRGEGAAQRLLHGSVSTKVLHHAPCAVLVVKADR